MKKQITYFIVILIFSLLGGIIVVFRARSQPDGIDSIPDKTNMEMIFIPSGEFLMGSDSGDPNQRPMRSVFLDTYWIDQTEVTNQQYLSCINNGGCKSLAPASYTQDISRIDHPVVYISWQDAVDFCYWTGKTLPTEAQWEKAAHGEEGNLYPWGNSDPNQYLLNYNNDIGFTTSVGSYSSGASPYGVLDMAGNVWEWTSEWYDAKYYQRAVSINPPGPEVGAKRVKRGGSWFTISNNALHTTFRKHTSSTNRDYGTGFRCVYEFEEN